MYIPHKQQLQQQQLGPLLDLTAVAAGKKAKKTVCALVPYIYQVEEEARVEEKGEGDREGEREKGGRRQLRSLLFFLALSLSLSLSLSSA